MLTRMPIMQMIAVAGFQDPQISSYTIYESREWMEEEVSFADYGTVLYFFFVDPRGSVIPLKPEIGQITLDNVESAW